MSLRSRWRRRLGVLYPLGSSLLALLLAVLSRVGGVEATASMQTLALVIILLTGAGVGTYIFFTQRNWRQAVAYVRTGRMPNREGTQSNEERSP